MSKGKIAKELIEKVTESLKSLQERLRFQEQVAQEGTS